MASTCPAIVASRSADGRFLPGQNGVLVRQRRSQGDEVAVVARQRVGNGQIDEVQKGRHRVFKGNRLEPIQKHVGPLDAGRQRGLQVGGDQVSGGDSVGKGQSRILRRLGPQVGQLRGQQGIDDHGIVLEDKLSDLLGVPCLQGRDQIVPFLLQPGHRGGGSVGLSLNPGLVLVGELLLFQVEQVLLTVENLLVLLVELPDPVIVSIDLLLDVFGLRLQGGQSRSQRSLLIGDLAVGRGEDAPGLGPGRVVHRRDVGAGSARLLQGGDPRRRSAA